MSAGRMVLLIAAILVYCGLLQRVLDRMYLTDRQALLVIASMLIGTWLPNIHLGSVLLNVGGCLIPLLLCIYLIVKANEPIERWRTLFASLLTAAAVYAITALLPAEAEQLPVDPLWINGVAGGVIAWILGRSRRAAFICGIVGVMLADIVSSLAANMAGYQTPIVLGGAGIGDAAVISGIVGVLMCEIVGESIERLATRSNRGYRQ